MSVKNTIAELTKGIGKFVAPLYAVREIVREDLSLYEIGGITALYMIGCAAEKYLNKSRDSKKIKNDLEKIVKVNIPLAGRFPFEKDKDYSKVNGQGQIIIPADLRELYQKRQKTNNPVIFATPGKGSVIAIFKEEPSEEEYEKYNPLSFGEDGRFTLPYLEEDVAKVYFLADGDSVKILKYKEEK